MNILRGIEGPQDTWSKILRAWLSAVLIDQAIGRKGLGSAILVGIRWSLP